VSFWSTVATRASNIRSAALSAGESSHAAGPVGHVQSASRVSGLGQRLTHAGHPSTRGETAAGVTPGRCGEDTRP